MPVLVAWLGELVATSIGAWCLQALIGVGVGLATYNLGIKPAEQFIANQFAQAGDLVNYIGWLGIDEAVTIVMSALIGRAALGALRVHLVKKV
jgi:Protein of unknown function (DUF2523).